ncbi:hypothetical protein C3Y87_01140 [Carbonactinospora thermoautotrophica]|uniref:Uncharacterized protein n=1 Tax=Carbonactinospora thermoautotrophica TaxID=1469144 RepID=A0A132MW40_9ACTN|nr:hypothetical protein [Carbonactinospora thermoautotrophica]KWX02128.1 hypothetical protein LI90_3169 [Carbonactinospora thermoautotrophica]KWX03359.1 hypothetical protein TH66_10380 [Carbonactinospora thermoautotrophica]MCX9190039.1 hypothetical protein [Carbonactinospora thermoautotrophica]
MSVLGDRLEAVLHAAARPPGKPLAAGPYRHAAMTCQVSPDTQEGRAGSAGGRAGTRRVPVCFALPPAP